MADLQLTAEQIEASNRHDVREVIYLLSGTLPGRGGVADKTFFWATRTVTFPLGAGGADVTFDAYLAPPKSITKSFGFEAGAQATTAPVPILIRNLPFAHSESLVAAFTDDDFALESATATLRVAYVRPGQTVDDLIAADFTPIVLEGFFGAPTDVRLDGLTLPVYNRGAKRSMALKWPRLPEVVPYMDADRPVGGTGAGGDQPIDEASLGAYPPLMFGRPDGWFQPLVHSTTFRGRTVSGHDAGDTTVKIELTTRGGDIRQGITGGGSWWAIGHRWPQYYTASGSIDEETHVVTLHFVTGISAAVPRGAYCQALDDDTRWVLAPHANYGGSNSSWPGATDPSHPLVGWKLKNGEIKVSEEGAVPSADGLANVLTPRYQAKVLGHGELTDSATSAARWRMLELQHTAGVNFKPAAYYDPGESLEVTQQPEFDSVQSRSMNNYATGGNDGTMTGAGSNSDAPDGNTDTGFSGSAGEYFELTFPSAPSPFLDGDTVRSTLHVVCIGAWNMENEAGSVTFGTIAAHSTKQEYRFVLGAAVQFDTTLRCELDSGGIGGTMLEAWWEHELETDAAADRTQDTVVGTGVTVGETMVEADLVLQFPPAAKRSGLPTGPGLAACEVSGSRDAPTMERTASGDQRYPVQRHLNTDGLWTDRIHPTQVMIGLHGLLGKEGHTDFVNLASYDAAHQRFVDEDIRVNMLLEYEPSWFELERKMGENFRSIWFYGPSGHECHFMESEAVIEASGVSVRQSFRLPGCPASNCFTSTQPFMKRTSVAQLINTAKGDYRTDYLEGLTTTVGEQENAESVAANGALINASKAFDLGWNNFVPHATSAAVPWNIEAQVSGTLQLYADRQAWARTRFTFETSWIALGVDRGSIIRVSYPVSFNPPSYRNNVCEVESVTINPLNAERYIVTARSVNKPQKGLDPAFVWTDVFTAESDQWTTRILQEFDTWSDYWSLPDS